MILKRFLIILSFILYPHISFSESEVKSYLDDIGNHCDNVEMETDLNKCINLLNNHVTQREEEIKQIDVKKQGLESPRERYKLTRRQNSLLDEISDITNLTIEKYEMFQRASKIRQKKQEEIIERIREMISIVEETKKNKKQGEPL